MSPYTTKKRLTKFGAVRYDVYYNREIVAKLTRVGRGYQLVKGYVASWPFAKYHTNSRCGKWKRYQEKKRAADAGTSAVQGQAKSRNLACPYSTTERIWKHV